MKPFTQAILFCLIVMLAISNLIAQPGTINSHRENTQVVKDLSGYRWKMKRMNPGQGVIEGIHKLPPSDIETLVWNPAHVPGDVYTDLWKAGVIDDPYFGRNTSKAQWVMYEEWWYTTQFSVSESLENKVVSIVFEGVDYSCEVWLNGHYLGSHEGAFSSFKFDVTEFLNSSPHWPANQNMLTVKLDPPPQVCANVVGRKTPWFGDYWRDIVPFGIWRGVKMVSTGRVRFDDFYVKPVLKEDGSADVQVEVTLENTGTEPGDMTVITSFEGNNFISSPIQSDMTCQVPPGKHVFRKSIQIRNPELWWPWDLGKPNLYLAKVSLKEGEVNHDFMESTFGIRDVKMAWNPGFARDEVSFPRTVMLNGKPHFIRSACWGGPPDIFVGRTSPAEYKKLIEMAKAANMNNIRIFGWHPPEIPEFYQYCDELGLTVWQDVVPLGTGNIPKDREFLQGVIAEAVSVIKERRNHPSLILIEGGEEMFLRSADAHFTNDFLMELGDSLHNYVDLPYIPDSPLTCDIAQKAGYKPKEAVHALAYFYGMGQWLMEDWYSALDFPIVPELAITSVPSVESLKKFIPENELWPPGLSWGHHWADLDRLRMQNFDTFGDERTGSLEEFVNATQDAQGTIFQLSVEHFRRSKPKCSGIALCHFITYWPDMKWGIVDNYQQPKRSYDFVKRAYQPVLVSLKFDKRRWKSDETFEGDVWVVNDLEQNYPDCQIELTVKNAKQKIIHEQDVRVNEVAGFSSRSFRQIRIDKLGKVKKAFTIDLILKNSEGHAISENTYQLLIGDQEKARKKMNTMGDSLRALNRHFPGGNYYRYFPEMNRMKGTYWEGQTSVPTARGF